MEGVWHQSDNEQAHGRPEYDVKVVTKRYKSSIDQVAYGITKDLKAAGYNLK
jgi:hypothetical protein